MVGNQIVPKVASRTLRPPRSAIAFQSKQSERGESSEFAVGTVLHVTVAPLAWRCAHDASNCATSALQI
jgi:hypothetical protein